MKKKDEITEKKNRKVSGAIKSNDKSKAGGSIQAKTQSKTVKKTQQTISNRKMTEKTFRLEAPQAHEVSVVGCFNGWDPMSNFMRPDDNGVWSCTMSIEPGEHEYRFVIDGVWCDDPLNTFRRPNSFGSENCVLII